MGTNVESTSASAALFSVLRRHAQSEALTWLEGASASRSAFLARYAGLPRKLGVIERGGPQGVPGLPGSALVAWREDDLAQLRAAGVIGPEVWSLIDVARGAILLRAFEALDGAGQVSLATEIFRRGDTGERVSVLRCLALAPAPEPFAALGAEACRSHVLDVVAALACENPFPARALSELAWNQMVMKALFVGLPLERVHAWQSRNNSELVRMTQDFAAERRAAGRPVPDDVDRIAAEAASSSAEVSL